MGHKPKRIFVIEIPDSDLCLVCTGGIETKTQIGFTRLSVYVAESQSKYRKGTLLTKRGSASKCSHKKTWALGDETFFKLRGYQSLLLNYISKNNGLPLP